MIEVRTLCLKGTFVMDLSIHEQKRCKTFRLFHGFETRGKSNSNCQT
jgi:hypothetical protein